MKELIINMQNIRLTVTIPEPALVAAVELLLQGVHPGAAPKPPAPASTSQKAAKAPTRRKAKPAKRKAKRRKSTRPKAAKRKPGRPPKVMPGVPPAPLAEHGADPEPERITGENVKALLSRLNDADVTLVQIAEAMDRTTTAVRALGRARRVSEKNTANLRTAVVKLGCVDLW